MKTIILAGGFGTRLREETEFVPKPMVPIGGKPIIWHIMKTYSSFGFNEFIVCAGYKASSIQDYFLNYQSKNLDFTVKLNSSESPHYFGQNDEGNWSVTITNTGEGTPTGGRLIRAHKYVQEDSFFCTYGDGVSDINIANLLRFHAISGKIATMTVVRPVSRFGVVELGDHDVVSKFREKPKADGWINGGFFVFNKEIFNYLSDGAVLESETLNELAKIGQLAAFKHDGFWQPMDTYREVLLLNSLWESGSAPWKNW
jgi:glucose-1-phosphate cytidylyltransferase